jgi:hypothetical protein
MWANNRFWMETQNLVHQALGGQAQAALVRPAAGMKTFEWGLKRLGQYQRGWHNAANIVPARSRAALRRLPRAFDGFSVLHISDPTSTGCPGSRTASSSCAGAGSSISAC